MEAKGLEKLAWRVDSRRILKDFFSMHVLLNKFLSNNKFGVGVSNTKKRGRL